MNRSEAPPFQPITDIFIRQPEAATLRNGEVVHHIRSGTQDVIKFEILIPAGKISEARNGVAYLSAKMLQEGIPGYDARDFSEAFDRLGAHLDISPGLDHIEITLHCLTRHFQELVPLVSAMLDAPHYPEKELNTLKSIRLQHLAINKEKNSFLATQKFRNTLFGTEHPYGRILQEDDIMRTSIQETLSFYKQQIVPSRRTYILSGKFDENILKLIEDQFGTGSRSESERPEWPIDNNEDDVYDERSQSVQTSIRIGSLAPPMDHPDYLNLLITNEILGGYFGSRLMKNIREEKGLTYGIYSGFAHMKLGNYFQISADVMKDKREEAISEIKKELDVLCNEHLSTDELETVRNVMLGQLQSSINTPFELASKFKMLHLHGLHYNYFTEFIHSVRHITVEEVRESAQKFLQPSQLVTVSVG